MREAVAALSRAQREVYDVLAEAALGDEPWPTTGQVAAACDRSVHSVAASLTSLKRRGMVAVRYGRPYHDSGRDITRWRQV